MLRFQVQVAVHVAQDVGSNVSPLIPFKLLSLHVDAGWSKL